jgi:hypothetical protein
MQLLFSFDRDSVRITMFFYEFSVFIWWHAIYDVVYRTGVLLLMNEGGFIEIERQYMKLIEEQKISYRKGYVKNTWDKYYQWARNT